MQKESISFSYTGTVFTKGETNARQLWLILHGYGQHADQFLSLFPQLDDTLIVAPEGLSQFYLKRNQIPVSSWMTSRFRDTAIDNYIQYLNAVVDKYGKNKELTRLLGFSQGCETATRWVNQTSIEVKNTSLWAGKVAVEIDLNTLCDKTNLCQYMGDKDPLIGPQDAIPKRTIFYSGGHEINENLIRQYLVTTDFHLPL